MRNRDSIIRNLELIEGKLTDLKRIVNTQEPINLYLSTIDIALNSVENVKGWIEDEELSQNELSR